MAVCYWEVTDPQGVVRLARDKGPMRIVNDADPARIAQGILAENDWDGILDHEPLELVRGERAAWALAKVEEAFRND